MLNNYQINQVSWGGKREGAGRPEGSTQKPRISDFITQEDAREFIELAKKGAREGRDGLLRLLIEQTFGKATMNTGVAFEEPVICNIVDYYQLPKREEVVTTTTN